MYTNQALEKSSNGMWLSLVERLVWDQDAAGSNPVIPTIAVVERLPLFVCKNLVIYKYDRIRTCEGRGVKQTVRWTVCSQRELERQRKPVSMQGEAEVDGNPPTRSSAAPCVSSTNEKLFTVVPIFRVSRMSSRPRGTTKVVPFLFIMIF